MSVIGSRVQVLLSLAKLVIETRERQSQNNTLNEMFLLIVAHIFGSLI